METKAAPRDFASLGLRAVVAAALAAVFALLALAGPAEAAKKRHTLVGHDGKIHACYRVKGRPKGVVRVVRGKRHRCRRGERRMAWRVRAPRGPQGQSGATGPQGQTGATGPSGSSSSSSSADVAGLESQVAALSLKLEALEGVLDGVTNGDLTGVLATLQGVTNTDLLEAIGVVPTVEALCAQTPALAEQVNLLQGVIGGLGLAPALELIGLLEIPVLPTLLELNDFGCAAP